VIPPRKDAAQKSRII